MIELPTASSEKLEATVESATDPASYTIDWSFPAFTSPATPPTVWLAGAWDGAATQVGSKWYRKALTPTIGSAPDLAIGQYDVYARINAGAEAPVIKVDESLVIV
jgi:hypothetical protein